MTASADDPPQQQRIRPETVHEAFAEDFTRLGSWSIEALLERTARGGAAPACGSAAAVTAGMAAALAAKVARRSTNRLSDADHLAQTCDDLRERATVLAAADARAVHAMVSGTGEVPAEAVSVPARIRDLAAEVIPIAARLAAHGSPALHADAVGAEHLAQAARGAAEAVLASNEPAR